MGAEADAGKVTIRAARVDDAPMILTFIKELAEYERLAHTVVATEESLRQTLFGPRPAAEVLLAEIAGEAVGLALFFANYSTFVGRAGIYLEDLYVRPSVRGRGAGRALLVHLAKLAVERGCGRLEWSVLDWNEPAIQFYKSIGAQPLEEWTMYRLVGDAISKLAEAT
jgi:GNAT superfamily N-acetyltransferase